MKEKNDNQEFKQFEKIEDIFPAINDLIDNICYEDNIDIKSMTNNQWDYILTSIYIKLISPNIYLILDNNNYYPKGKYIKDNVYKLYDYYVFISRKYNKKTSLKSFLILTNINSATVYNCNLNELLNDNSIKFSKKVQEDSEQSLVGLMQDRGNNAIAYISELNTRFGWNSVNGHSTIEDRAQRTALSDARSEFELFENDTQLLEDDNLE